MPQQVEFNGVVHEFPDDFTEADIAAALGGEASPPAKGLLPTAGSFIGSAVGTLGGIPGRIAGAAAGGALGKGAELFFDDKDDSFGDSLTAMGKAGLEQGAYEAAGGAVGKGLKMLGGGLYRGGVALLPRTLKEAHPKIAETGLKHGIALTKRGARKAGEAVKASAGQADDMIAAAEKAGARPVNPIEVVRELRPVGAKIRNQEALGMASDMPGLTQRAKSFVQRGPIPLTKAQELKREAQDLAQTAYKARDKGAVINNIEALTNESQARGLRKALEARVSGLGDVNASTQALIGLREGAEHASGTGHILSRLGAGGLGAGLASAGGALPAAAAAGTGIALNTPGGLTATGLALRRVGSPIATNTPEAMRLSAILSALLEDQENGGEQ